MPKHSSICQVHSLWSWSWRSAAWGQCSGLLLGEERSGKGEAQKSLQELEVGSLADPGSMALRAVVHGWITLGAHELAGPASKAGEVVKADPVLVLEFGALLGGLIGRVFEELWTKDP